MNSVFKSKTLKFFIAIAFLYSPYSFGISVSDCKADSQTIQDGAAAQATQAGQMQAAGAAAVIPNLGQSVNPNSEIGKQFASASSSLTRDAAANMAKIGQLCAMACDSSKADGQSPEKEQNAAQIEAEKTKCEHKIQELIARAEGAAGQTDRFAGDAEKTRKASEGGMSPMMAGLLGAALGGAAGYMMGKKKKDKDEDKADDDIVSEDGVVDCTKPGAEAYSDCNAQFEAKCSADLNAEGCANFTARYCGAASAIPNNSTPTADTSEPPPVIIASASDKDITGEGMGGQFCFTAQATNFCASSGRETCPSCLQLQANKADACKANPALCLMQNSPTEIESAKNTCPSDPLFSNPDYVAGGGATVENADTLEDPILPTPYNPTESSDTSAAMNPVIPGSGSSSDTAGDRTAGSSDTATGSSSSSSSSNGGVIGSTPSDVASGSANGSSGLKFASASQNGKRAPASKVVGEAMGPSLFAMSSAMIESRCRNAQLAHCSK